MKFKKIYFIDGNTCENLDSLIKKGYSRNGYFVNTYSNSKCTKIECKGLRRSFEDLMCIANTYFPGTTEENLMSSLINNNIRYYFCYDIKKIVFHGMGTYHVKEGFVNCRTSDSDYLNLKYCNKNTYTLEKLQQIYKNLKQNKQMNQNKITRTNAVKLINNTKGKFFTVSFKKADGTERTINGKYNNTTKLGYLNIYSMKDKGYRNINPRTLLSLKINNQTYFIK